MPTLLASLSQVEQAKTMSKMIASTQPAIQRILELFQTDLGNLDDIFLVVTVEIQQSIMIRNQQLLGYRHSLLDRRDQLRGQHIELIKGDIADGKLAQIEDNLRHIGGWLQEIEEEYQRLSANIEDASTKIARKRQLLKEVTALIAGFQRAHGELATSVTSGKSLDFRELHRGWIQLRVMQGQLGTAT